MCVIILMSAFLVSKINIYNGCIYTIHEGGIKTGFKKHGFCLREHIHELVNANAGIRY